MVLLKGVAQWTVGPDAVVVASSNAGTGDVADLFEVVDDLVHRPLGDPDPESDVAKPDVGLFGNAKQHVGVVR